MQRISVVVGVGLTNTDSADNPQLADDLSQVVHDYSEALAPLPPCIPEPTSALSTTAPRIRRRQRR